MNKIAALTTIILLALTSLATAQAPSFQDFLAQFPKAALPYAFSTEQLQGQIEGKGAKANALSWEYYEFLPELERSAEFSSMPVHPQPVASFETEKFHAVLYNIARGIGRSKTYSISVFTKDGQYVGTHFVAGVNAQTLTTAVINEELKADVKEYKLNWVKLAEGKKVINGVTFTEGQEFELTTFGNPDQIEWVSRKVENTAFDMAKMK